jgi:hypothetical protein
LLPSFFIISSAAATVLFFFLLLVSFLPRFHAFQPSMSVSLSKKFQFSLPPVPNTSSDPLLYFPVGSSVPLFFSYLFFILLISSFSLFYFWSVSPQSQKHKKCLKSSSLSHSLLFRLISFFVLPCVYPQKHQTMVAVYEIKKIRHISQLAFSFWPIFCLLSSLWQMFKGLSHVNPLMALSLAHCWPNVSLVAIVQRLKPMSALCWLFP